MTRAYRLVSIVLMLVSTLALLHRTGQTDEPRAKARLETRLPSNTIASVSVANFKEAWAEFLQTDLGKTGFGGHFDALRKELVEADQASMLHLKPWWGFDWNELKEIDTEASLLVVRNGKEVGAAWWFEGDPKADSLERLRASVSDYFEKEKKLASVKGKFGEADWAAHVTKEGDDPAKVAIGPVLVTTKAGVCIASDWKTAEGLAKSFEEGKAIAAATPAVDTALESIYPEQEPTLKGRLRGFVRPGNIAALIRPSPGAKGLDYWQAFWKQICNDIECLGLRIELSPGSDEEIRAVGAVAFKPPPADKATLPVLKATSHPDVPKFVPHDVGSVMKFGVHPDRMAKRLGAAVNAALDEPNVFESALDGLKFDKGGPKVDIRADMIGQLEDSLLHFMDGKHPPDRKASAIRRAALFPVADEAKVATVATKLWSGAPDVVPLVVHGCPAFVSKKPLVEGTEFRAASVWKKEKTFAIGNNKDFFIHLFDIPPATPLIESEDFQHIDRWWKKVAVKETCVYAYFSPEHLFGRAYQEVVDAKILKDAKDKELPEHPATPYLRLLLLGESELQKALKTKSLPASDEILSNWPALGWTLANSAKGMQFDLVWLGASRKAPAK
jgi:hypothetical protein